MVQHLLTAFGLCTLCVLVSCQTAPPVRRLITPKSWVRLQHGRTGMYLTSVVKYKWGTMQLHPKFFDRFHIIKYFNGYRIEREFASLNYIDKYVGCNMKIGVYLRIFDRYDEKQVWKMSKEPLRDGDYVLIQSVENPGAYMAYSPNSGGAFGLGNFPPNLLPDVKCQYPKDPRHPEHLHYWKIELLD